MTLNTYAIFVQDQILRKLFLEQIMRKLCARVDTWARAFIVR